MASKSLMEKIYYSPKGYFMGKSAIDKLANSAKVPYNIAKDWLAKQAIWQIYLPRPKKINYSHFDVNVPNEVHQADILFLPHDKYKKKVYKYALTIVDIASRYKDAFPLSTKSSSEVAAAFKKIYQKGPLRWPKLLQVDPGREFLGEVSSLMTKQHVKIRRGNTAMHRDQAIVERFNRTLADKLFYYQTAKEFIQQDRSREWVERLPEVIDSLNNQVTSAINMKPSIAVTKKYIKTLDKIKESMIKDFPPLPRNVTVRYLYEPGELEGGKARSTDPIWSITTHQIYDVITSMNKPTRYKLDLTAPQRSFTYEQLQVIPEDTQLPPKYLT